MQRSNSCVMRTKAGISLGTSSTCTFKADSDLMLHSPDTSESLQWLTTMSPLILLRSSLVIARTTISAFAPLYNSEITTNLDWNRLYSSALNSMSRARHLHALSSPEFAWRTLAWTLLSEYTSSIQDCCSIPVEHKLFRSQSVQTSSATIISVNSVLFSKDGVKHLQ